MTNKREYVMDIFVRIEDRFKLIDINKIDRITLVKWIRDNIAGLTLRQCMDISYLLKAK